jgi:ApaG protein
MDAPIAPPHLHISVKTNYLAEESIPDQNRFLFSYQIRIENKGERPVQLMERHWIITDADGQQQEVRGPGVVGKQPVIAPGHAFEYASFCPLSTPIGTMEGVYSMVELDTRRFEARIPAFRLAVPDLVN